MIRPTYTLAEVAAASDNSGRVTGAAGQLLRRPIVLKIEPRSDGGLRVWSDDFPGLILSHRDQEKVLLDIGPAIIALLKHHRS